MTIIIVLLATVIACLFGLYLLLSDEIRMSDREIKDRLEWIEKQNNLLREEVNRLRLRN